MNTKLFLLATLCVGLFLWSCDKEPEVEADFLQCNVDGVNWQATQSLTGNVQQDMIIVNGVCAKGDTLRMLIQDHEPGTHLIKNIRNITLLKTEGKTYVPLNSADGYLTVTEHDESVIKGTFYLTVDAGQGDWKEITGGGFKVTY